MVEYSGYRSKQPLLPIMTGRAEVRGPQQVGSRGSVLLTLGRRGGGGELSGESRVGMFGGGHPVRPGLPLPDQTRRLGMQGSTPGRGQVVIDHRAQQRMANGDGVRHPGQHPV